MLTGFQIVVVDDASTDPTQFVLDNLVLEYPELTVRRLVTNSGQSAATMAGIRHCKRELDRDFRCRLTERSYGFKTALEGFARP